VEHRGEVKQLEIRFHPELVRVEFAEEKNAARVVVDEGAGSFLDQTSRRGDRHRVRNLHPRDDLRHDLFAFREPLLDCWVCTRILPTPHA
jgi:hypothetical protein